MPSRLRDQDRALAACRAVQSKVAQWQGDPALGGYRQELQQLPARILASGLGQTLAFYASKRGEKVYEAVGSQLAETLTGGSIKDTVGFLNRIMNGSPADYRRDTRSALAYAEWLKRYAAALIDKPEKNL
jgi:CRISPR type III-B/RAMP module-associated protein Cmr5